MTLDMPTISLVSLLATTMLGLLLCFIWWRDPSSTLIGWWGVAQLVMATGISFAAAGGFAGAPSLTAFGQALMLLSGAIMWLAVREFEGKSLSAFWVVVWPCTFIIAAAIGIADTFDDRLILASTLLGVLHIVCAAELARRDQEPLVSRWPAIILLLIMGVSYLAWLPLTLMMPVRAAGLVYASAWFPAVILVALLGRITVSFVVLAMVKERQEIQQRMVALTDPLTGLPNRRALFESAESLGEHGSYLKDPIAVLVFDLDHFKMINDTYGHHLGDRVLQLFSATLSTNLDTATIFGRLGGEEFAAILPGASLSHACNRAECIRAAFADAAAVIDGLPVAGTVSVGVATHQSMDCDLGMLFHRADGALYAAKQNGRNRVQVIGPDDPLGFGDAHMRTVPPRWFGDQPVAPPPGTALRRYRGSVDAA